MRYLLLLTAFAIVCLSLLGVVLDFFSLSFNPENLWWYFVIAIICTGIYLFIGWSLNRKSEKIIREFISSGDQSVLTKQKKLYRLFNGLMLNQLPFLLFLEFIAVFAAIDFGLLAVLLLSVSGEARIPLAIPIGVAIVVLGTLYGVLIALYYLLFPKKTDVYGLEILKDEHPRLWLVVQEVASEAGALSPTKIYMAPDSGISVHINGSLIKSLFGRGERVLTIGLPSIYNFTIGEFKAILAHEFGHFSNKDTQWGLFSYSLGSSLSNALEKIPGPTKVVQSDGVDMIGAIKSVNPGYWILRAYLALYLYITRAFTRIREVRADIGAVNKYGSTAFINGLKKVHLNDLFFSQTENNVLTTIVQEGKGITSIHKILDIAYEGFSADEKNDIETTLMLDDDTAKKGTHPPLSQRVKYAQKIDSERVDDGQDVEVGTLFNDWDGLLENVTDFYNYRLTVLFPSYYPDEPADSGDETKA